ncbi:MBOAT family O-acyltransferase [Winogradskyella aurantiaca]|uniref:MBOAT family O-acyltransferase n=1 Tax=Winogradskyella aurantiaca TaxID=2219558 RepID=UPI000E1DF5F2|nr:MBOAT family O-acyltransferase [Winogradskyella aurantiaca]
MLFNSLDFAIFLPIVFGLYWFVFNKSIKVQNILILLASYVFYGWWDWRFLALIAFSTILDYFIGISIIRANMKGQKRGLLALSIIVNIGFLAFFKYYNFFVDSFIDAFSFFGHSLSLTSLNIILPVGISFYTFQTLSYTIDVYRGTLKPTKNFVAFASFVSFFPQLVAGPIERASNLLPQFYKQRKFIYRDAVDGMRQILWGLFKKVVIADNCAIYVNEIFGNSETYNGSTIFLGSIFFAFQIYGDFSGYSDIAIGTARLFGFDLKQNFAFPYFSRDIAEFWRRWHISLSTWFRDYLYIPLGGSRGGRFLAVRNTIIVFVVSGFWHGANWTFIFWGAINAFCFLPLLLTSRNRRNIQIVATDRIFPKLRELVSIVVTFLMVVLIWIMFRADTLSHALHLYSKIFSLGFFELPSSELFLNNSIRLFTLTYLSPAIQELLFMIVLLVVFNVIEWFGRNQKYAIQKCGFLKTTFLRWGFYLLIVLIIIMYSNGEPQEFIYFQF